MSKILRIGLVFGISILLLNCPSTPPVPPPPPPPPPPETVATPVFALAEGTYTTPQTVEISTTTEGAEIRYTVDGSAPSASNGTVYGGPISINATATVKAIATKTDWIDSSVASATYTITGMVAAPTFSLAPGVYTEPMTVELETETEGAEIRYTVDGSAPSAAAGTVYSGPVTVSADMTVNAIAVKAGWDDSPAASAAYVITGTVADVQMDPPGGSYGNTLSVTLTSATPEADIYYTTDGSAPAISSAKYSNPVEVNASGVLKALAVKQDWLDSGTSTAEYALNLGTVAAPEFSPAPGTYKIGQNVAMFSATAGAEILYTTDGSTPSATNGSKYTGSVRVEESATLRAIASKPDWTESAVASAEFLIMKTAPIEDSEIAEVRNAIARAKEADADIYDPGQLQAAMSLLNEGLLLRFPDPETARQRLVAAKEKADIAYRNSVARGAEEMARRMEASRQKLLAIQADKWTPSDYERATAGIDESQRLYAVESIADARSLSYKTLKDMTDLYNRLQDRLYKVGSLKREAELAMRDLETSDAYKWAPGQQGKVNGYYLAGIDAWEAFGLDDAEVNFGAAREAAKETLRIAAQARDASIAEEKKKADELMMQAMQALRDASELTVVTEDGTVIQPENWSEEDFLKEIEKMEIEEQKNTQPAGTSMLLPSDSSTVVLAEESQASLLSQAKELWQLGLEEKGKGNYVQAQDYFTEALRYIEIYKSYAVKGVYAVRLIPERRDCLWRIAEYDYVYGDPYQWPRIWRRNRKLIQNPDLIYPGWQLVIPL